MRVAFRRMRLFAAFVTRGGETYHPRRMQMNAKPPRIRIIGVPLDLGAGRRGVDMGPSALRVAGLDKRLEQMGCDVEDSGDLDVVIPEQEEVKTADRDRRMRYADAILQSSEALAGAVRTALDEGFMPLALGGDHSIAIGTVAGASAYFQARGESIGVVWLDAHGDMNTPESTPSGNIHGMGLAISCGLGDPRFTHLAGFAPKVDPRRVALVGARDLDPGERDHCRSLGVTVFTMRDLDELGAREVMRRAIEVAGKGAAGIHVQLDMDVIDPEDAPGTGTPVRGGLTYREAHLAMELLADSRIVRALDIVEINPVLDEHNRTAELGTELVLSALGKRII